MADQTYRLHLLPSCLVWLALAQGGCSESASTQEPHTIDSESRDQSNLDAKSAEQDALSDAADHERLDAESVDSASITDVIDIGVSLDVLPPDPADGAVSDSARPDARLDLAVPDGAPMDVELSDDALPDVEQDVRVFDAARVDVIAIDMALPRDTLPDPEQDIQVLDAVLIDSAVVDVALPEDALPDMERDGRVIDAAPIDSAVVDMILLEDALPDAEEDEGVDASPDAAVVDPERSCADGEDNDDDGLVDCADPDCDELPCRAPAGPCDAVESCVGGQCPPDGLQQDTLCRPALDDCDVEERCDGASVACPEDEVEPDTTICREADGPCDVVERCDGVHSVCPLDEFEPDTVVCNPTVGPCDVPEHCSGSSAGCPEDLLAPPDAVCRPEAGMCDVEERCDGVSPDCPDDAVVEAEVECRASVGNCDAAEFCDGESGRCPADNTSCQPGYYCSDETTCLAKHDQGSPCTSHAQCLSGRCHDGYCCDRECSGVCRNCGLLGQEGTCVTYAEGTDPENECGGNWCEEGRYGPACGSSCYEQAACKDTHYCCRPVWGCAAQPPNDDKCYPRRPHGSDCYLDYQCASGKCWKDMPGAGSNTPGTCCDRADCGSCCSDCSTGECIHLPDFTDPHKSGCGRYTCNGQGGQYTGCGADIFNCSAHCGADYWCWEGVCERDMATGACLGGCQCESDICWFWSCFY